VDNDFIGERITQMRDGIERAKTSPGPQRRPELFPPLVLQMISVGEETGAVDDLLLEWPSITSARFDYDLKNLSSAIEPVLLVVIGHHCSDSGIGRISADVGTCPRRAWRISPCISSRC